MDAHTTREPVESLEQVEAVDAWAARATGAHEPWRG